jgi:hypothetical protein
MARLERACEPNLIWPNESPRQGNNKTILCTQFSMSTKLKPKKTSLSNGKKAKVTTKKKALIPTQKKVLDKKVRKMRNKTTDLIQRMLGIEIIGKYAYCFLILILHLMKNRAGPYDEVEMKFRKSKSLDSEIYSVKISPQVCSFNIKSYFIF